MATQTEVEGGTGGLFGSQSLPGISKSLIVERSYMAGQATKWPGWTQDQAAQADLDGGIVQPRPPQHNSLFVS